MFASLYMTWPVLQTFRSTWSEFWQREALFKTFMLYLKYFYPTILPNQEPQVVFCYSVLIFQGGIINNTKDDTVVCGEMYSFGNFGMTKWHFNFFLWWNLYYSSLSLWNKGQSKNWEASTLSPVKLPSWWKCREDSLTDRMAMNTKLQNLPETVTSIF